MISIDIFYIYIFVALSFVIKIYMKISTQLIEHLNLLNSFDEGLLVKNETEPGEILFANKTAIDILYPDDYSINMEQEFPKF